MTGDLFASMASELARCARFCGPAATSLAAAARQALVHGPMTAQQLGAAAGIQSKLVRGVLKGDVDCGRVRVELGAGRRATYRLAEDWDGELAAEIAAARALLRRHGYLVTRARQ